MEIMFLLIVVVSVLGTLAVFGAAVAIIVSVVARRRRVMESGPLLAAEARVVEKRSEITGGGDMMTLQTEYVTFEFPDGRRVELALPGPESGLLVAGDAGTLTWQGSRYLGFSRAIMR